MRSHYNIILFDGSYFLFRNQSVSKGISANKLAGSLIQTLVKTVRDLKITFDVGFLAFDRRPYHRTELLYGKYKDGREYFSDNDVNQVKSELESTEDESKKAELDKRIKYMQDKIDAFKTRNEAIRILGNLSDFGINLIKYKGYEADDLARIITDLYSDKYSVLLLSIDSDWIGLVRDNVDYLRVRHKGITEFYESKSMPGFGPYVDMVDEGLSDLGLSKYLEISESLGNSHNDMRKVGNVPIGEVMANWEDLSKLNPLGFDSDTFERQVNSFNYKAFSDYINVKNDILNKKYNLESLDKFNNKFILELCTGITSNYYKSLYERIRNYSLLQL